MKVEQDLCEETTPDAAMKEEISELEVSDEEDVQNDAVEQADSGSARAENMLRVAENPAVRLCVNQRRSIPIPSSRESTAITVDSTQLTIFHGGKVSVFDGIPSEKVHEILSIAVASAKSTKTLNADPAAFTRSLSFRNAAAHCSSGAGFQFARQNSFCRLQADLPIARRHSLKRFLEKRRDRHLNASSDQNAPTKIASDTVQHSNA